MKKFFSKLAVAVGCLLMVLIPLSAYNRIESDKRVVQALKLSDSISVIAVGHSHVECALDPAFFPEMADRARSGEGRYYALAKSMRYIECNVSIKSVIVAWSFFNSRGDWSFDQNSNYDPFRTYFPLFVNSIYLKECHKSDNTTYFLKNYIQAKFGIPTKVTLNSITHRNSGIPTKMDFEGGFLGEFKAAVEKDDLMKKVGKMARDKVTEECLANYITEEDRTTLDNFMQACKEKGVQVVLFNAPTHKDYNEAIHPGVIELMNGWATEASSKYGMHYIDFHEVALPDSMFRDYNHINTEGAKIITPMLRDTLQKLGVIR